MSQKPDIRSQKAADRQPYLYKDRRFAVTAADIRTRTAYYPIADTVGRIRRDILFAGLALSGLVMAAVYIYADLLYDHELYIMGGIIAVSLLLGVSVSMLQLDARGFPARIFIARSKTVRMVFDAITEARAIAHTSGGGFDPDETGDQD